MSAVLDAYDEIAWEAGYGPVEPFGDCAHECRHEQRLVIAAGPDGRRFQLVRCMCSACNLSPAIQCRQWRTKNDIPWGPFRAVWVGTRKIIPA